MHYRNGREAKNGDKIVKVGMSSGQVEAVGVLHSGSYAVGMVLIVRTLKKTVRVVVREKLLNG